jgi:hypothetical protein
VVTRSPIVLNEKAYMHPDFSLEVDQREGYRPEGLWAYPVFNENKKVVGVIHATNGVGFRLECFQLLEKFMPSIEAAIAHTVKIQRLNSNRDTIIR